MLKPICVPCQRFFRPKENGFDFLEGMPVENRAPRGILAPEKWKPYKLWSGDKWFCEGCGTEIIVGTGVAPIAIQHENDFAETVRKFGATFQVNDC